jgi:thiamine-phosphate pyrophosphorylase
LPVPAARPYVLTPPAFAPAALLAQLTERLAGGDVAAVELALADAHEAAWTRAVAALRPAVQAAGAAFLLRDRAELAAATGCDGVHLTDPAAYPAARRRLGPGAIVGVSPGEGRHGAMSAGEAGADFVGLAGLELVSWWAELMEVPCVAFGAASPAEARALAEAGADFVAVVLLPGRQDAWW